MLAWSFGLSAIQWLYVSEKEYTRSFILLETIKRFLVFIFISRAISMLISHEKDTQDVFDSFEKFDSLIESGLDQCLDEVFASVNLDYQVGIFQEKLWLLMLMKGMLIALIIYTIIDSMVFLFIHRHAANKLGVRLVKEEKESLNMWDQMEDERLLNLEKLTHQRT